MTAWLVQLLASAIVLLGNGAVMAGSAGCEYWDKFESHEIESRLDDIRSRWLAIQPTRTEIAAERQIEVKNFTKLGYRNPQSLAASQGDDFYVRRIRKRKLEELYGEPETDQELWVYCLSRPGDCAGFFARQGRPAEFDGKGELLDDDAELRTHLNKLRDTVVEFNLYAQITALTYCDCDGSEEAVRTCKKARTYLFRDF